MNNAGENATQLRCNVHGTITGARLLAMATRTENAESAGRPRVMHNITHNMMIDHVTPRMTDLDRFAGQTITCTVPVREVEVRRAIEVLYPGCNQANSRYENLEHDYVVSKDTIIRVPLVSDAGTLTSGEQLLTDLLDMERLELRGTFDVTLTVAMESINGEDTIGYVIVSDVARTAEPMRYMTDTTFPYYVLCGHDISYHTLDDFMITY